MTQSTDKKEMPANGGGVAKGKPDGVSGSPDTGEVGEYVGHRRREWRRCFPNPHSGKGPTNSGFSGGREESLLRWR